MDLFNTVVSLFKQYGAGATAWILLFGGIAWIAGKGGKAAIVNVKTTLDLSREMQVAMAKDLREANETIRELRQGEVVYEERIKVLNRKISQLENRVAFLESKDL